MQGLFLFRRFQLIHFSNPPPIFAPMQATVYKSTGSWYITKTSVGTIYNARIKGIFKIDSITSTNPVAVGDIVDIEIEDGADESAVINNIHQRKNYIARTPAHAGRGQRHIIASNLDQAMLFATFINPRTSQGFIDRFLTATEAFHVPAVLVFNKADIYKKREMGWYHHLKNIYNSAGYPVLLVSIKDGTGVEELKNILQNKTTLLSGHSGVGKSTFINSIFPDLNLKTNEVSGWSGKGMHTTTFAEMFDLPGRQAGFGGRIIDTPGIREFGITDIDKPELSHYFPEMRKVLHQCKFNDCLHINEPGCAVKEAVEKGELPAERYISYCNILDSLNDKNY